MTDWNPYREPIRATLTRTVIIALVMGAIVAAWSGNIRRWPVLTILMLWPALGGHWVEILFLNWLRPRLPTTRAVQRGARIAIWFVGGIVLALGARWTAALLLAHPRMAWLSWSIAGAGFIAVELLAHAALQLRGRPSFYNGLG